MDLTEELFRELAQLVLGSTDVPYGDKVFHFGEPFVRLSVFDSILKYNPELTADDLNDIDKARAIAKKAGAKVLGFEGLGKLQVMIFEELVEHKLEQPHFITSTRSKCRRWPVATTTTRTSPTVSSCSSAAAKSPTPTPS
jgi:lysyl-tRNA synthetase class 2